MLKVAGHIEKVLGYLLDARSLKTFVGHWSPNTQ